MSENISNNKTGGASIKPSARPSIHSHSCCPFAFAEAMGRYGIKEKDTNKRPQSAENSANSNSFGVTNNHGTDEVDNAFSKLSNPISPSSFNKDKRIRTKSWDEDRQLAENDSSNILSQSLPATFLQHSYCSDDSEVETPLRQDYQYSDTSYQSATLDTPQNRTPGLNRSNINRSQSLTPHNVQAKPGQKGSSRMTILLLLVGVLVTVGSMFNPISVTNKVVYDESRFYNDIDLLGMKYRIEENAVLQMQSGIATISERQDTGSFMFVYNSNLDNFNLNEFNKFVNDVSITASKYLRNQESIPVHYTLVEGSNLDMFEHSELINMFRKDLDETGVMLVKHVEAVPSALAMAFHYYCDEYNPLVKKSAVFFTLNLAKCPVALENKSTHALIEKCLAQKWDGVPADSIGPLLTRVVSVVIDVTRAF